MELINKEKKNDNRNNSTVDFSTEMLMENQCVVIYGASVYGELAYYLLEDCGIKPDYYCDRLVKGSFLGIPVIDPDELATHRDDWVIIASADYFHELVKNAKEIGCKNIGNLSKLFIEHPISNNKLSKRAVGYYVNRQNYIDVTRQRADDDSLNFTRIQYVVSERCSLKCKDCLHLMQYYKEPKNIDIESTKVSFERLLRVADSISEIRILGGEPFMNREMYKIIKWWHDNPNISLFRIYTNGVITPSDDVMEYLAYPKVDVYISDYEINRDRIEKTTTEFEKKGIKYYVSPYDGWADAGDLHYRNHSIEENIEIFGRCHARNCISFIDGQLHRCPRSAHAMRLGAMPDVKEDYVDIKGYAGSDEELKREIRNLQEKTWIEACNYCDGADLHVPQIPAGVQTERVLDF